MSSDWIREARRRQGLDPDRMTDPATIAKLARLIRQERKRQDVVDLADLTPDQQRVVRALIDAEKSAQIRRKSRDDVK